MDIKCDMCKDVIVDKIWWHITNKKLARNINAGKDEIKMCNMCHELFLKKETR